MWFLDFPVAFQLKNSSELTRKKVVKKQPPRSVMGLFFNMHKEFRFGWPTPVSVHARSAIEKAISHIKGSNICWNGRKTTREATEGQHRISIYREWESFLKWSLFSWGMGPQQFEGGLEHNRAEWRNWLRTTSVHNDHRYIDLYYTHVIQKLFRSTRRGTL